jgi:hypothetical protein
MIFVLNFQVVCYNHGWNLENCDTETESGTKLVSLDMLPQRGLLVHVFPHVSCLVACLDSIIFLKFCYLFHLLFSYFVFSCILA